MLLRLIVIEIRVSFLIFTYLNRRIFIMKNSNLNLPVRMLRSFDRYNRSTEASSYIQNSKSPAGSSERSLPYRPRRDFRVDNPVIRVSSRHSQPTSLSRSPECSKRLYCIKLTREDFPDATKFFSSKTPNDLRSSLPDPLPVPTKTRSFLNSSPFPNVRRNLGRIERRMIERKQSPQQYKTKENIRKVRKIKSKISLKFSKIQHQFRTLDEVTNVLNR